MTERLELGRRGELAPSASLPASGLRAVLDFGGWKEQRPTSQARL